MEAVISIILNAIVALTLLSGMFFMLVGAVGVARLPDFYSRTHAASKCVTLGIANLLIALVLYIAVGTSLPQGAPKLAPGAQAVVQLGVEQPVIAVGTKAVLVIVFIFIAAPVGSHMLARAAHVAGVRKWEKTLSDDLEADRANSQDLYPLYRSPDDDEAGRGGSS